MAKISSLHEPMDNSTKEKPQLSSVLAGATEKKLLRHIMVCWKMHHINLVSRMYFGLDVVFLKELVQSTKGMLGVDYIT